MIKGLRELKRETSDINSSLIRINDAYGDGLKRLAKLSGTTTKFGAAWSVVSRLTVGLAPTFHKAEAALRSLAYIAKYVEVSKAEAAKSDKESLSLLKTINEERSDSLKLLKTLDRFNQEGAKAHEKELVYQNKQVSYLIDRLGEEKGILEARKRILEVTEKAFRIDEKLSKSERNRLYNAELFKNVRGQDINSVALVLKYEEDLKKMDERRRQLARQSRQEGISPQQKELIKEQLKLLDSQREGSRMTLEAAKKRTGYNFTTTTDAEGINRISGVERGQSKTFREKQIEAFNAIKDGIQNKFKGLFKFFSGPSLRVLGGYIATGYVIFKSVLLYAAIAGGIIYILHRTGFIEAVANFFKGSDGWKAAKVGFKVAWEGIKEIGLGVWEFLKAIANVFVALFTGGKLFGPDGALGQLVERFFGMLASLVSGSIKLVMGLLAGVLITFWGIVWSNIQVKIQKIEDFFSNPFGSKTGRAYNEAYGGEENRGQRQVIASARMGEGPGSTRAKANLADPRYRYGVRASGGPVIGGRPYLVGEGGPEMFVPGSSGTILSNSATRGMGNTINVHVNGRVGATDQELNDLARKLGEKINREMNRFGASGYRA